MQNHSDNNGYLKTYVKSFFNQLIRVDHRVSLQAGELQRHSTEESFSSPLIHAVLSIDKTIGLYHLSYSYKHNDQYARPQYSMLIKGREL